MLVTVFGPKTTLGLVRFYSVSAVKRIAVELKRACSQTRIPIDLGGEIVNAAFEVFKDSSGRS
jgi:hypothetical protein